MHLSKRQTVATWVLQILVAAILFQTLFFKFTAAEESVYIFTTLGMEPWGRIGSGIVELIACLLLIAPRPGQAPAIGALLTMAVMVGAIVSHLTRLGIVVKDDGGLLFILALVAFLGGAVILIIRRDQLPVIGRFLGRRGQCNHPGPAVIQ